MSRLQLTDFLCTYGAVWMNTNTFKLDHFHSLLGLSLYNEIKSYFINPAKHCSMNYKFYFWYVFITFLTIPVDYEAAFYKINFIKLKTWQNKHDCWQKKCHVLQN